MLPVGVLALQGDFREHVAVFDSISVACKLVRTSKDLASVSGLVIPGGESTTIYKLAVAYDLFEPISEAIRNGLPALGTCAGLIMLSTQIQDAASGQKSFGGLDVSVRRNAFGNQQDSFEVDLDFKGVAGSVHAAFIRAPIIEAVAPGVEVLSTLDDGRVVAARQGSVVGLSFHPEVTGEKRIHRLFVDLIN